MNPPLTRAKGRVNFNGHQETWYSQKRLPGNGLNIPGRHVASDGTIRDGANNIVVATCMFSKGSIVQTSLGQGKVYDYCPTPGVVDIYTNW